MPPVGGDDWVEILWEGDISVYVGSLRMLLAMKLYANRGRRDTEDIEFLLGACDVTSLESNWSPEKTAAAVSSQDVSRARIIAIFGEVSTT